MIFIEYFFERETIAMREMTLEEAVAEVRALGMEAREIVALLKKVGDSDDILRGRLRIYCDARVQAHYVVDKLIAAITMGHEQESLSILQKRVELAGTHLHALRELAESLAFQNQRRDRRLNRAGVKAVVGALAAFYNNFRTDNQQKRKAIQTQLEASRSAGFRRHKGS